MILANITKAIREQNWFAVATEFVIVIAGVVIGFQITAWNEARAERVRAELYLERLIDDADATLERFRRAHAFRRSVRALGVEMLDCAEGRTACPDDWAIVHGYFNASQAGSAQIVGSTYREMLATGDLRLIEDIDLRRRLTGYYDLRPNDAVVNELSAYREHVRELIPIPIQEHVWSACYAADASGSQALRACGPPETLDPAGLADLAERLRNDETLNGELRYWVSSQYAARDILGSRIALTESLRAAIAEALEEARE